MREQRGRAALGDRPLHPGEVGALGEVDHDLVDGGQGIAAVDVDRRDVAALPGDDTGDGGQRTGAIGKFDSEAHQLWHVGNLG